MSKDERGKLKIGKTSVPYVIERSTRRRKTIEIQFLEGGRLRVAAPATASRASVEGHLASRSALIVRRMNGHARTDPVPVREYVNGETFEYLGRQAKLRVLQRAVPRSLVKMVRGRLDVTIPRERQTDRTDAVREALLSWYRGHALHRLRERVAYFAHRVGVAPVDVVLRAQERRWASCSQDGILRFNWRIVMAPASLGDYVVVHELCHLQNAPHDESFWRRVGTVLPDYQLRRSRLRTEGPRFVL